MDVQKFNEYLDQIDKAAIELGFKSESITSETGPDCWFDNFTNGDSPNDAVVKDMQSNN